MCGITGFFDQSLISSFYEKISLVTAAITHREPDDGVWVDDSVGVALDHRRLSIVDLSPAGHQPMISPSGRYVIVFNGEIYNHFNLRDQLSVDSRQRQWKGHSDAETLLACFEFWGLKNTLSRAVGMFALALWDKDERKLYLARDRLGEKPLYYGWVEGAFVFGSELKALKVYLGFNNAICRNALAI